MFLSFYCQKISGELDVVSQTTSWDGPIREQVFLFFVFCFSHKFIDSQFWGGADFSGLNGQQMQMLVSIAVCNRVECGRATASKIALNYYYFFLTWKRRLKSDPLKETSVISGCELKAAMLKHTVELSRSSFLKSDYFECSQGAGVYFLYFWMLPLLVWLQLFHREEAVFWSSSALFHFIGLGALAWPNLEREI